MEPREEKMSPRQRIDADKRRRLTNSVVAAAEDLVSGQGLANLRARDIAAMAGCSTGSLYNAFGNFDDIVLKVNSMTLGGLGRLLAEIDARLEKESPEERLVALSHGYLDYAMENRNRWSALFEHRMPQGKPLPDWHLSEHMELIAIIDGPMSEILPGMDVDDRRLLCRTLYSAVHGIVSIGSENRMGVLPRKALKGQLELTVRSVVRGLSGMS